jgi:hypothetical protein
VKKLLGIMVLGLLLSGNANAVIAIGSEWIPIDTVPSGSRCELINNKGRWNVTTPNKVKIKRSKKPLEVICEKDGFKKTITTLYLRDPKKAVDVNHIIDAAISGAMGDPFFAAVNLAFAGVDKVLKKFGTYATHRKEDKLIIVIELDRK